MCISNKYHQPCFEQGMCVDLNLQGMPAKQVLRQQQYPQQVIIFNYASCYVFSGVETI